MLESIRYLKRISRNSSGMALLLTLAAISFLVALTVQLATSVNWQVQASTTHWEAVRLNQALYSGLSIFRAALYADQQDDQQGGKKQEKFDSLLDNWNTLDMELVSGLAGADRLSLTAQDLSGRIQVNRLWLPEEEKKKILREWQAEQRKKPKGERRRPKGEQANLGSEQSRQKPPDLEKMQRELWKRFLTSGMFAVEDDDQALALIDALIDWLDDDDDEGEHGAEKGYYLSLDKPYPCRNGPLQYPEELLLVKGFSREIVYGGDGHEGILPYLTTITGSDGKININTAPAVVLQALVDGLSEELVELLVEYRENPDNEDALKNPLWYRQVEGFPGDLGFDPKLITIESSFFACTITAGRNGLQQSGKGFIYRDPETKEQTLLSWKVE